MAPGQPSPPPYAFPDGLLQPLLAISLTAVNLLRPLYGPTGSDPDGADLVDFGFDYLNPAAQRMTGLPEQPGGTALGTFPDLAANGVFDFYRRTFRSGAPDTFALNYQADGLDNYFRIAAQRVGEVLLVSFTDTAAQPRTAVEIALRESQAREQQARAEVQRQREELQHLFEQAPVALAVFRGPRHVVEMANPAVLRMWGRTPAQALNTPLFELLPEISGQGFEELLAEVLATGQPHVAHEMPSTIDRAGRRDTVYWNFVYQPLREASGQVAGVTVVAAEVTPQVLARQELQQLNQELEARVFERTQALHHAQAEAEAAAQRLLRVTESLPSTTFTADQTGQVLYVSPQWYAYTGMALGTPIGAVWPQFIHPDDLPAIAREYGAALAEGRAWRYEFRLRGADGRYRWFASQGVPEPLAEAEAAGRPRQWFGSNLDIHDLKQAQHALEQQEQRLREILGQSPAMIATLEGPDHRFAFTNPGYDALVGQRARLGVPVAACFPEVVAQGFIDLLDGVYRTGQPHVGRETPIAFQPAGGAAAAYFLDFTYQPLRDLDGRTTGVLAFVVDVTERVHTRQQAEALQAQLLAAAQRQAQERETLYQIFAETPAAICIQCGPDHRFEYVNAAYQAFFPARPLLGLPVAAALPETVEAGAVALLDRVYQTGETYFGQELLVRVAAGASAPARDIYFNFTYQAYRENGAIVGISTFAYDATEQVLAREAREAQRRQLHRLFMEAPAGICILAGPELVYELVNPRYQQLFPGRALLGKPLLAALPELADQPAWHSLRRVYETGETHEEAAIHIPLARYEGGPLEDFYFHYIQQARFDEHGRVDGVLVFVYEISEQVQARQAAEAVTQQLRLLTDALPVLIGYLDREERYQFANQAYEVWFRRAPADVLGRTAREVVGETAYASVAPNLTRALAGERFDVETTQAYQPGFSRHVRISYIPDVQAGQVVGCYTMITDLTEQVQARERVQVLNEEMAAVNEELRATNEELYRANAQLSRTNIDLDNFIYTASHDLKAPITNIEGLLDTLRYELSPPVVAGDVPVILGLMDASVDRFKRTIDHLTDVSNLQKEPGPAPDAPAVALAPVVEDVRLDLAPLLQQTAGHLELDVAGCPPLALSEKNLRSVVYNLLSNALKYRHPDRPPVVRVRTRQVDGFVVLEVEDNGLGLDLSREEQLFAMFQRLHAHVEGSGLGLYMVKRMVENAGGRIAVHSEVGEGTTFSVYLPH